MTGLQAVVLAGGDGERLRPLTERWLGHHTPKQYCSFVGTRSMLDHTLDRAASSATRVASSRSWGARTGTYCGHAHGVRQTARSCTSRPTWTRRLVCCWDW